MQSNLLSTPSTAPMISAVSGQAEVQQVTGAMSATLNADAIAALILRGFRRHFRLFLTLSEQAGRLFLSAQWTQFLTQSAERIHYYDDRVQETISQLQSMLPSHEPDATLWYQVKLSYINLLRFHPQAELAETFYNSVFCRLFARQYFHNRNIFVESSLNRSQLPAPVASVYHSFFPVQFGMRSCLRHLLQQSGLAPYFADIERDIRLIQQSFVQQSSHSRHPVHHMRLDVLSSVFYRNKAAYIVGRVVSPDGQQPFILALLHSPSSTPDAPQLEVDSLITDPRLMSIIFGFSRAYFMVQLPVPSAMVQFLKELMPHKTLAELYACLGLHKQAKNEFYRELLQHLAQSRDHFVIAPGTRGLVMAVFTLPSFPYVFKVIKDTFGSSKSVSREQVKQRYRLVKQHDRVGRMADTMEFSNVALPRQRFSAELLAELQQDIAGSLSIEGDVVLISHLYIERRMTPLDLALQQCSDHDKDALMQDFGHAIKDMMAANIFPGDMLLKNFGVTRHGRVVFYDYDEVQYLLDMRFRTLPKAQSDSDLYADEPWFAIEVGDVFPEQISTFVTAKPELRQRLWQYHPELLDAAYWQQQQQQIRQGVISDFFPYPAELRFRQRYPAAYDDVSPTTADGLKSPPNAP